MLERRDAWPKGKSSFAARQSSCKPPGRGAQPRAVYPQPAFRLSAVDPPQAHATTPGAGATGTINQFVAQQGQRILELQRLNGQVGGVGHVDMHAVQSVTVRPPTRPAAYSLQVDPDAAVLGMLTDKGR